MGMAKVRNTPTPHIVSGQRGSRGSTIMSPINSEASQSSTWNCADRIICESQAIQDARARGSIAGLTTQQGRPKGGLHVRERSPDVYGWLLKIAPTVAFVEPPWETNETVQ